MVLSYVVMDLGADAGASKPAIRYTEPNTLVLLTYTTRTNTQ